MQNHTRKCITVGLVAVAMACASQPVVQTSPVNTVSSGDVSLADASGIWVEPTGVMFVAPGGLPIIDLEPASMRTMTDANIAGHLVAGDSLEIAMSAPASGRAQNADVRNFAQGMVNEHTAHLDSVRFAMGNAHIVPMRAGFDTADAAIGGRMMNHLATVASVAHSSYDRQFMRSQVALHQHMLGELDAFRSQATPSALPLVNNTRRTVREHLLDAKRLYRQLGGKD